jgi:carbon monoxide dehydrogenase subunit G
MRLEHDFVIPAPVEDAWKLILDVERTAAVFPGGTVESADADGCAGKLTVRLGPITVTYRGQARVVSRDENKRTLVLGVLGREARGSGTAEATARIRLEEQDPTTTRVIVRTNLALTGRPADLSQGVIREAGARLLSRFSSSLAVLATEEPTAPAAGSAATPGATVAPVGSVVTDEAAQPEPVSPAAEKTAGAGSRIEPDARPDAEPSGAESAGAEPVTAEPVVAEPVGADVPAVVPEPEPRLDETPRTEVLATEEAAVTDGPAPDRSAPERPAPKSRSAKSRSAKSRSAKSRSESPAAESSAAESPASEATRHDRHEAAGSEPEAPEFEKRVSEVTVAGSEASDAAEADVSDLPATELPTSELPVAERPEQPHDTGFAVPPWQPRGLKDPVRLVRDAAPTLKRLVPVAAALVVLRVVVRRIRRR